MYNSLDADMWDIVYIEEEIGHDSKSEQDRRAPDEEDRVEVCLACCLRCRDTHWHKDYILGEIVSIVSRRRFR